MKKYLMMGAVALAMSSTFVSCSKDTDYFDPNNEGIKMAEYTTAFVKTFGEPAADQNWGFGATRVNGNMTRAIQPTFNFPGDADPSKFLERVPAVVNSYSAECQANGQTDGYGAGTSYVDPSWTGQVNIWGGWDGSKNSGGTLYIKGENDFTNRKFYVAQNTEIYLVKDAVLKLSSTNASDLQGGCKFYLADGAKIITDAELVLNNGLQIYNHGTIEANKLHANSNSVLYNAGIVKVATKISVENELSVIVNDGTITAADLNTAGSGKFENNGTVTISGTTFVNSNSNTWVNNGQYHTGNFLYNAASDEVINNCKLIVDENFNVNLGDNPGNGNFKMDAGASVVTQNFNGGGNWSGTYADTWSTAQGGPFYIYMGAGSVFKVTGTATMNASKPNYGIYGPTDGSSYNGVSYAVFQANSVVMGKKNQGFEVTYGGNLAVVAGTHFKNGNDGQADHPFIDFKGNAAIYAPDFTSGLPTFSIDESECNPGFEGDVTPPSEGPSLCVLAEDLCAKEPGEFDFNDVVIDVYYVSASEVKIILRAAGGTVPLRICQNDNWEIHKLFGVPVTCMVNTGTKYHTAKLPYTQAEKPYVELSYTGFNSWSDNQDTFNTQVNHQIKLEVGATDEEGNILDSWVELKAQVGQAAQKVAMPVDAYVEGWYDVKEPKEHWAWEKQYVGDGFKEWVIGQSETFYQIRRRR